MDDSEIISLYWERDQRAISETNDKYGLYCLTVARNILNGNEDSEECVNDTWFHTWNSIPPSRPSFLKLFLAKITRNLAIDKLRSIHREKRSSNESATILDEIEEYVCGNDNVEAEIDCKELGKTISSFLRSLSLRDRYIFLRRYFYGEGVTAIAEQIGVNVNIVSLSLSRNRKRLKEFLQKEGWLT